MAKNPVQNLIDSGLQFTEVPRKEAERMVRRLVNSGAVRRAEADKTVQSLIERGRQTSTLIAEIVKGEVARQLARLANRIDDVEDQLEGLVGRVSGGRAAPAADDVVASSGPSEGATDAVPAGGKAPAGKSATRKSTAKKASAKKTASANKTPGAKKTAGAKKATGAKKTPGTKKAAAAKKSGAQKAPAKKSAGSRKSSAAG